MKIIRMLPAVLFSIFVISSSFAQQDNMMKKDDMNHNMKMKDNGMKSDSTIKNDMNKDMNSGKMMMKKNDIDMNKDKMKSNSMMKKDMMTKIDKNKNGVAIKGYDPVAYFTDSKSEMGKKEFSYKWNGAEWYFANKNHMEMFKENPGKYAPQYGGFCAFGLSKDKLSSSDPNSWQIVDEKLYLCTNNKVHKMWQDDIKGNVKKAGKNWSKINSNM
ncbi:MAG: YHS domain-containing (seleno)protein [Ignavibacteriaceae bacterium]